MDTSSLLIGILLGAVFMAAIFIGTDRMSERRKSPPTFMVRAADKFAVRS